MEDALLYLNGQLDNIKKIMLDIERYKNQNINGQGGNLEFQNLLNEKEQIMKFKGISIHKRKDCHVWQRRCDCKIKFVSCCQ